jgi:hypothetical protein
MFSQWVVENAHFTKDQRQLLKTIAERLTNGRGISEQEAASVKSLHERAVNNLQYVQGNIEFVVWNKHSGLASHAEI